MPVSSPGSPEQRIELFAVNAARPVDHRYAFPPLLMVATQRNQRRRLLQSRCWSATAWRAGRHTRESFDESGEVLGDPSDHDQSGMKNPGEPHGDRIGPEPEMLEPAGPGCIVPSRRPPNWLEERDITDSLQDPANPLDEPARSITRE